MKSFDLVPSPGGEGARRADEGRVGILQEIEIFPNLNVSPHPNPSAAVATLAKEALPKGEGNFYLKTLNKTLSDELLVLPFY